MSEIVSVKTKSGEVTYRYDGKLIYSAYDPHKEALSYISGLGKIKDIVITICGADFINRILADNPNISQIITHDPYNLPPFSESKKIKRFDDIEAVKNYILNEKLHIKNVSFVIWKSYIETNPPLFKNIIEQIKNTLIKSTFSINNEETFTRLENSNIKNNLKCLDKIEIIRGNSVSPQQNALVISSGASLCGMEHFLKSIKDRFITFALPSALPYLEHINFRPDYVIAVDPGYGTFYHLAKTRIKHNLLIPLSVSQSILKLSNFNFIFFSYGNKYEDILYRDTGIVTSPPEGSVIFNLLRILKTLDFDKTLLVGQDFSYFNNKSHINGGFFETEYYKTTNYYAPIDDIIKKKELQFESKTISDGKNEFKTNIALQIYFNHFIENINKYNIIIPENAFNTLDKSIKRYDINGILNEFYPTKNKVLKTTQLNIKKRKGEIIDLIG